MNVDPMLFQVWYEGEVVNQNAQMPREVRNVNFEWIGPEVVPSSPEHGRRTGSAEGREGSSSSSEVEPETINFEYQLGEGVWTLPLHLRDLNVATWDHVNGAMVEAALLALYPGIFLRSTRIAVAANGQVVRPHEFMGGVADPEINLAVVNHGAGPPLPEVRHLTNRRRPSSQRPMEARAERAGILYGIPPLTRAFEALHMEAENGDEDVWLPLRNDPAHIRIALRGRGQPRLLQLYLKATSLTVPILEVAMRRQYQHLIEGARLMITRRNGEIVGPTQQVIIGEEQILWAVISDPLGSNGTNQQMELTTLLKEVQQHMHGRLKGNQIKLLIRGEQGLAGRLHKSRYDPQRQCAILLDAAARYDMHVSPARGEAGLSSSKKQPDIQQEEWQTVKRKATRPVQVLSGESNGKHSSGAGRDKVATDSGSAEKPQYRLKEGQWSQPIMDAFTLDIPGVALAPTQEKAEKWARQLAGTKHAVGLITVQPLEGAQHVERMTIELIEQMEGKPDKTKVVGAYVNSFSQTLIRYIGKVAEIKRTSSPTTTTVLRARTQASAVSTEQWKQCRKLSAPPELRRFLQECRSDLHIEDIFRVESTSSDLTFLLRVHTRQEADWLRAHDIPMSFSPVGCDAEI